MGDVEGFQGLDDKIRAALLIRMSDESSKKRPHIVGELSRKFEEAIVKKILEPTGRQMIHIIRSFYEVKAAQRDVFEIKHLHEFTWWGDGKLRPWKRR